MLTQAQCKAPEDLEPRHKQGPGEYEYVRRQFVRRKDAGQCVVSIYEIPPGKAAYPYHYHMKDEEVFYIIRGEGLLRTPQGERRVCAGELLFFPAGEGGAHKLRNTGSEPLVYIDFDTANDLDVAFYPDSGKIGVWGMDTNMVFRTDDAVDYYQDE